MEKGIHRKHTHQFKTLANDLEANPWIFKSAYWANAIPDHIEDTKDYVTGLNKCVNNEKIKISYLNYYIYKKWIIMNDDILDKFKMTEAV